MMQTIISQTGSLYTLHPQIPMNNATKKLLDVLKQKTFWVNVFRNLLSDEECEDRRKSGSSEDSSDLNTAKR